MQSVVIVNASNLLMNEQVRAYVPVLQTQVDRDFIPAWGDRATAVKLSFAGTADISSLSSDCWPIFLNKHSTDPGALGWHDDQTGKIFSRVFVGDCMRAGLDWGVTLSHELLELILDPDIVRVWKMPDGRYAALEACDAVEADELGYSVIGGLRVSNFVLPAYFGTGPGPYDFRGVLKAPCPALTPGGYMSIRDLQGDWSQINADRADGIAGRRALMKGHRRQLRAAKNLGELEEITF